MLARLLLLSVASIVAGKPPPFDPHCRDEFNSTRFRGMVNVANGSKQMVYLAEDQWTVPPRRVVLKYELAKAYNSGLKHARVHKGVLAHRGERLHCMSAGAVRRTSPPPPPLGTLPAASPTRGLVTTNYLTSAYCLVVTQPAASSVFLPNHRLATHHVVSSHTYVRTRREGAGGRRSADRGGGSEPPRV